MEGLLKEELNKHYLMSDGEWQAFLEIISAVSFEKSDVLLSQGRVNKGIYYVVEGAFRTYHLKDGNEISTAFYFEKDFIHDIESLSTGLPSKSNIVAIEKSEAIYIPKSEMIGLYDKVPTFHKIGKKILELMVITEKKYSSLFTDYLPKERYEYILTNHPELVKRVSSQHLASFLGVARETLSRIRKRIQ